MLDKSFGPPRISKDGVTVAREIELGDRLELSAAARQHAEPGDRDGGAKRPLRLPIARRREHGRCR